MAKKSPGVTFPAAESRRLGLLWTEKQKAGQLRRWFDEDVAKLKVLCKYYGIQDSEAMFAQLALTLARELYPERRKPGAKTKWTRLNRALLVVDVERTMKPGGGQHGIEWACRQLAKREPWKSLLSKKSAGTRSTDAAEALRRVYFDSRDDNYAKGAREAFEALKLKGTLDEWDAEWKTWVTNPQSE